MASDFLTKTYLASSQNLYKNDGTNCVLCIHIFRPLCYRLLEIKTEGLSQKFEENRWNHYRRGPNIYILNNRKEDSGKVGGRPIDNKLFVCCLQATLPNAVISPSLPNEVYN
jgi:hypothetical protein